MIPGATTVIPIRFYSHGENEINRIQIVYYMTFQATNKIFVDGREMGFAAIKGTGFLIPKDFGIATRSASSGCWRGYIMCYEIRKNEIFIKEFWVKTDNESKLPVINGIAPKTLTTEYNPDHLRILGFTHEYKNVHMKLPFTGTIWLVGNPRVADYVPVEPADFEFYGIRIPPTIFDLCIEFSEGNVIK